MTGFPVIVKTTTFSTVPPRPRPILRSWAISSSKATVLAGAISWESVSPRIRHIKDLGPKQRMGIDGGKGHAKAVIRQDHKIAVAVITAERRDQCSVDVTRCVLFKKAILKIGSMKPLAEPSPTGGSALFISM